MLNIEIRPEEPPSEGSAANPSDPCNYEGGTSQSNTDRATPSIGEFSPSQFKRKLEAISQNFKKHMEKQPMRSALDQIDNLTKKFVEEDIQEPLPKKESQKAKVEEASFDWRKRLDEIKKRN